MSTNIFGVAITEDGDSNGRAYFAGYEQFLPELRATYDVVNPIQPTSWGRTKAVYR